MTDLAQRDPRQHDPGFLRYVRRQPCCLCGTRQGVEAAHIRMADRLRGYRSVGMQEKPHDRRAVPLCGFEHREAKDSQHAGNEGAFWKRHEVNPFIIAEAYFEDYRRENPKAPEPFVKKRRPIKARKPRERRQKIKGRSVWPKKSRS